MKHSFFAVGLICIIFSACIDKPKNVEASRVPVSTEPLDTILSKPAAITAKPLLFETAFVKGTKDKIKDLEFTLYGITIGNIKITSGNIVACDPYLIDEYGNPYVQQFPTGEFPVQLSIANLEGKGETIAFARIKFSDEPVAKWEYALLKGDKQATPGEGKDLGYVIDAGYAIYVDKAVMDSLGKQEASQAGRDLYKKASKKYRNGWSAGIYEYGKGHAAIFSTGIGDGWYSTYVGRDANGNVCRLLSDFGLFKWKTE